MLFFISQKIVNNLLRDRWDMEILFCFRTWDKQKHIVIKSNVNSVLVLVVISKVFFHNESLFFNKVMSSSGNVWIVLRIQQICNTTRHKSPIYGLFTLYKRSQRDNISTIQCVLRRFRKVYYTSGLFVLGCFL